MPERLYQKRFDSPTPDLLWQYNRRITEELVDATDKKRLAEYLVLRYKDGYEARRR